MKSESRRGDKKERGYTMRKKKEYPLNGKNVFGLSTMGWMNTGASSFMTSMFMLYLTDYSGIGAWAAVLGTVPTLPLYRKRISQKCRIHQHFWKICLK